MPRDTPPPANPARPPSAPVGRGAAYGLLLLIVLLWGANWPIMKVGLTHITPLWFATARMLLGAASLFVFLAATGRFAWPTRQDWPVILSVGLLQMALFQPLVNFGLHDVAAGRASVLVYTTPLWVVPGAVLFLGEKVNRLKLLGLGLGLAGIAVLFNPAGLDWSRRAVVTGSLLLMLASMLWSVAILHIRGHRWHLSPLQLTPWQLLLAGLVLLPFALVVEGDADIDWSPTLLAVLLYNGPIATGFCFWAATAMTRALPAVTSSLSFLGVPVMGVVLSTLSLGEPLDLSLVLGFGLILCGVVLVNLADSTRARQAPAATPAD
jgi:drug/metabolite transporter (DMT)-like permease